MNENMKTQTVKADLVNKPMESLDLDAIAKNILIMLTADDIDHIKSLSKDDLIDLHHSLGQNIRNNEKLWCYTWTANVDENGIDYSPYHPDAVSMTIIEKIYDLVIQ